jgi:uncharacterized damage-inducible protein DinB
VSEHGAGVLTISIFTNPPSRSADQAEAYTRALLELVGARDPMEILRTSPLRLRGMAQSLSEEELSRPEAPGKWSVRQVVRHLADSEVVWGYRLRMVLGQDRPPLTGYDQDGWAERLGYQEAPVREAVDEFDQVRRGNLRLLARTGPDDLKRVGVHSERGEESVAHMIPLYAGHDLVHLRQIERILGRARS